MELEELQNLTIKEWLSWLKKLNMEVIRTEVRKDRLLITTQKRNKNNCFVLNIKIYE